MRTEEWRDETNDIAYPVEIYYPGAPEYQGADLDAAQQDTFENLWEPGVMLRQAALRDIAPAGGEFPYIINMHGWSGLRVEFTYLSTHLASHGYLVGFTGPSFGGWTALIAPWLDPRIKATVPQRPAGGNMYVDGTKQELGPIDHGIPTLMLVGSRDSLLPLLGQFEIYHDLVRGTRRMIVLLGGDHVHFGDDIVASHEWMDTFLGTIATAWPGTD